MKTLATLTLCLCALAAHAQRISQMLPTNSLGTTSRMEWSTMGDTGLVSRAVTLSALGTNLATQAGLSNTFVGRQYGRGNTNLLYYPNVVHMDAWPTNIITGLGALTGIDGQHVMTTTNGGFDKLQLFDDIAISGNGGQYTVTWKHDSNTISVAYPLFQTYSSMTNEWVIYPPICRLRDANGVIVGAIKADGGLLLCGGDQANSGSLQFVSPYNGTNVFEFKFSQEGHLDLYNQSECCGLAGGPVMTISRHAGYSTFVISSNGATMMPRLGSNAVPVNAIGQDADGKLYKIALGSGSSISIATNANQFAANPTLTLKPAARHTNSQFYAGGSEALVLVDGDLNAGGRTVSNANFVQVIATGVDTLKLTGRSTSTGGNRVWIDTPLDSFGELNNSLLWSFNGEAIAFGANATTNIWALSHTADTTFNNDATPKVLIARKAEKAITIGHAYDVVTNWPNLYVRSNLVTEGRVGVGTNAPTSDLHIRLAAAGNITLRVDDTNGTPRAQMGTLLGSPGYGAIWIGDITATVANYAFAGRSTDLSINSPSSSAPIIFQIGGTERGRLAATSGFFGVGVSTPSERLSVAGNVAVSTNLYVTNNIWAGADVSALTFTDRSNSPDDTNTAIAIVRSVRGKNGHVDHSKLHPALWGKRNVDGELVPDQSQRDLGMLASAQSIVLQDLLQRAESAENNINILLAAVGVMGVVGAAGAGAAAMKKKKTEPKT